MKTFCKASASQHWHPQPHRRPLRGSCTGLPSPGHSRVGGDWDLAEHWLRPFMGHSSQIHLTTVLHSPTPCGYTPTCIAAVVSPFSLPSAPPAIHVLVVGFASLSVPCSSMDFSACFKVSCPKPPILPYLPVAHLYKDLLTSSVPSYQSSVLGSPFHHGHRGPPIIAVFCSYTLLALLSSLVCVDWMAESPGCFQYSWQRCHECFTWCGEGLTFFIFLILLKLFALIKSAYTYAAVSFLLEPSF